MGIEKKILSLRLDDEVINDLKELAEKENRSLSNFIETILKHYLEYYFEGNIFYGTI